MDIGIIGCGNISPYYIQALKTFSGLRVAAVADLDVKRAQERAAEQGIARAMSPTELLADDAIDLVVNLTIPKVHPAVSCAALKAGKHVYSEKPLALDRAEAAKVLALAKKKKRRVGCAPDTVLGAGIQTCRKLIDDGAIGRPVAAS